MEDGRSRWARSGLVVVLVSFLGLGGHWSDEGEGKGRLKMAGKQWEEGKIVKRHGKFIKIRPRYSTERAAERSRELYGVGLIPDHAAEEEALEEQERREEEKKELKERRESAMRAMELKENATDQTIWFYNDLMGRRQKTNLRELRGNYRKGIINEKTYVFTSCTDFGEISQWTRIGEFEELKGHIERKLYGSDMRDLDRMARSLDFSDPTQPKPKPKPKQYTVTDCLRQLEVDRGFIMAFYDAGICEPELDISLLNRTITDIYRINPDVLPASWASKRQALVDQMIDTCKYSKDLVETLIELGNYIQDKGIGYHVGNSTNRMIGKISRITTALKFQIRRSHMKFRSMVYGESDLSVSMPDERSGQVQFNEENKRLQEEKKKELKRRRKRAKDDAATLEKKALRSQQKKEQLEAYLLRLPTMTVLQARRILASIMDYSPKYFDRFTRDAIESFVKVELEEGLNVAEMKDILEKLGYPHDFLFSMTKTELRELCEVNGVNVDR
ncbi:hypothetical protein AAMO2058_000619300 [Amorphochlora amoebiformis]